MDITMVDWAIRYHQAADLTSIEHCRRLLLNGLRTTVAMFSDIERIEDELTRADVKSDYLLQVELSVAALRLLDYQFYFGRSNNVINL